MDEISNSEHALNHNTNKKNITFDEKGRLWLRKNEYLTKKEADVLKLILFGKTSKQIAKVLGLSHRTIEEYTGKIKRKLQCSYKYEIHSAAIAFGIIQFYD